MLLEFRVSNYRSIAEEQVISFVPNANQKEYQQNIFKIDKYELLNTIGVYGANASGKSNLLKAMSLMDGLLNRSARLSSTTLLPFQPFLIKEGWNLKPTEFEVTFLIESIRYRYGFTYNESRICSEWLFKKAKGREVALFQRQNEIIEVTSSFKGNSTLIDAAIEATRDNALFLSFCDVFNIKEAKQILNWFSKFYMIDGLDTDNEALETITLWEKDLQVKEAIKSYLSRVKNLGFSSVEVRSREPEQKEGSEINELSNLEGRRKIQLNTSGIAVFTQHQLLDTEGNPTQRLLAWSMEEFESAGTNKAFHLLGPIMYTILNGGTLIIDEIEAKMHPLLTLDLINLFLRPEVNTQKAQLIFATHDTNLLSYANLRRDQIYFTNKNLHQATEVFSLSDFKYLTREGKIAERPDVDKEKRYLEGRYEAVPVFNGAMFNLTTKYSG